MKLISSIEIDHFRSVECETLRDLGDFTAFAGLNNAGKSNVLRALHAFFTGNTDTGLQLEYSKDYFRHDVKSRRRSKNISISVTFSLPDSFRFRKGLEPVEQLLGRKFVVRKAWERGTPIPKYYLNESRSELSLEDRAKVEAFLNLINFRYIPNRVLPLDIIKSEHQALRDVLIRRLAKRPKSQSDVFVAIRETSESLIKTLQNSVRSSCPDVGKIRLATPLSWQDLIFAFGYKLTSGNIEVDDAVQGSGIQSLLMLETLSLIDRDYFQKFGWRQAAVWAVEEPESSLHTSLEARVAGYLGDIAKDSQSRLQILCTTHSDLMLQNADHVAFVTMEKGRSSFSVSDRRGVLERAANLGISRWTHPILCEPLLPVLLVEGKYDHAFLEQGLRLLAPRKRFRVSYLEILQENGVTGGKDALLEYIRSNRNAIKVRMPDAPVIVVLDWDAKNKVSEFRKLFLPSDPFRVFYWPESTFNPKLGPAFRGTERHMSERIILAADSDLKVLGKKQDETYTINSNDYGKLKSSISKIVIDDIMETDLVYARSFLEGLLKELPGTI